MRDSNPATERDDPYLRQRGILAPEGLTGTDVELVGAGSLGGTILLCLLKMGFGDAARLRVWDFDRCETHNLGTQWFRRSHVALGQLKVEALAETAAWICDREPDIVRDAFTGGTLDPLGRVVILAVDSLVERRRIWNQLKRRGDFDLLIDVRMGAEVLEIFTLEHGVDPVDDYLTSLDDGGDPFEEPCTHRAIMYTPFGAAAYVGSILRGFVQKEPFPRHLIVDFRNFLTEANGSLGPPA